MLVGAVSGSSRQQADVPYEPVTAATRVPVSDSGATPASRYLFHTRHHPRHELIVAL